MNNEAHDTLLPEEMEPVADTERDPLIKLSTMQAELRLSALALSEGMTAEKFLRKTETYLVHTFLVSRIGQEAAEKFITEWIDKNKSLFSK